MNLMAIKTFQNKKFAMKLIQLFASVWLILIFSSCGKDTNRLTTINSESFHEKQVTVHFQSGQLLDVDSLVNNDQPALLNNQQLVLNQLDGMMSMTAHIRKSGSDTEWVALTKNWTEFNSDNFGNGSTPFSSNHSPDSLDNKIFPEAVRKWAELNADLVKLSGEARFGDALEKILYGTGSVFISKKLIKSVIYTHIFDHIFINIIGSSSVDYHHTTGGNVRIIQETNYPQGNEMTLKSECSDLRYMDVFIRIPSWAINPTVTHGNVKYVARPGEYCQISRKWKTGDEISVVLRN